MTRDRRKAYRKSPGRQYGYDYDPLSSQQRSGASQSGRQGASSAGERQSEYEDVFRRGNSRAGGYGPQGGQLATRPDLRRTRQLLRQNILASKTRTALSAELDEQERLIDEDQEMYEGQVEPRVYGHGSPRRNLPARTQSPAPRRAIDREAEEAEWEELGYVDPDIGEEEDPLGQRLNYTEAPTRRPAERGVRRNELVAGYEEDQDEDQQARPGVRRVLRKRGVTRRSLLIGLGVVAVGGAAAVAAYELPKLPQAISDAGKNIEKQLEDSFNKGFTAGANAIRKEFITALDNLEGVSLDAAMSAAKLTRVAYDVFVSPIVTFLANIADDFLTVTLRALITGRHWLANIGQDNGTLASLQKVLENWVQQVQQMPKQIQAVTDADLDGAQAYLRALQRKLVAEEAQLNASTATPTSTAAPKATGTPQH